MKVRISSIIKMGIWKVQIKCLPDPFQNQSNTEEGGRKGVSWWPNGRIGRMLEVLHIQTR